MKLKFSGVDYGWGSSKIMEVIVPIDEDFSIEHDGDMTLIHYDEVTAIRRESFKCEVISE